MSNLVEYAKSEMRLIGYSDDMSEDDPNKWMWDNIIGVVEKFSEGGHSGSSAGYAVSLITKLLRYQPLSPLTFADDEWVVHNEMGEGNVWQNKRRFTVFSDDEGKSWYDIEEENVPRHYLMVDVEKSQQTLSTKEANDDAHNA
jgi:hypothetical protein